ncbi:hypothetical protein [Streptantibioticus ferralitis]|uniref:Secreted protein n=1 Tax=Streptantibioticus ferralitis TaxID=236510 RepID=A0ABT5YZ34_9ACTN|nr:hypothetical protein [Streptantibioticus ferralitis]MDF2256864.1 hypothetical protein [Streptantibioticus ferralitis]
MRRYPRTAALLLAAAIAPAATPSAAHAVPGADSPSGAAPGTQCRTQIRGSAGTAVCHNPDPAVVHVRLHIVCRRWWDPATDTRPVPVGPAQTVTLTGRCWKEIRSVWITRG